MKNLLVVIPYLFLIILNLNGQSGNIDSLKNILDGLEEDTMKVNTFLSLSIAFSSTSLDSSLIYTIRAEKLSMDIGFDKGKGDAYRSLAFIYANKAKYDSSAQYIQLAKPIYNKLGDKKRIVKLLNIEANALEKNGDYAGSQKLYYKSLKICEENKFFIEQIDVLNAIAIQSMGQRDVVGSIELLEWTLEIAEIQGFDNKIIRACINLSVAHDSLNIRQTYLKRAITLAEPLMLDRELGYAYAAKAIIETSLGNYDEAISLYHKSMGISRRTGDRLKEVRVTKQIADVFLQATIPDSAEYYYLKYLNTPNYADFKSTKYLALKSLSDALFDLGKTEEAYDTLVSAYNKAKIVYEQNLRDNMAEADVKYETEKKDAELAKQELEIERNENQRKLVIGGALTVLMLFTGIYFWYYERHKRKKREAEIALVDKEKEAEKLKELDKMKTAFFTNVSHELRTPLTLILGPLSDVLEKIENASLKKSIHLAHANAERLLDMVNEIMDLSKLESGTVTLQPNDVELKPFLHRVIFAFESMTEMRNIRIQLEENLSSEVVTVDKENLEKILNNLISNAIKFSPNKSLVTVKALLHDQQLNISVTDEGEGIDPDEKDEIFNRFYQSNVVTAVEGGGTGIGLAISRELAELFGGTLEVKSQLGKGSTFTLSIPILFSSAKLKEKEIEKKKGTKEAIYSPILINGEKPHILIVEDNQEMREYLGTILDEEYRVSYAPDSYVALQALQKTSFDIISSDIMMPHMDGFELKKKVNGLPGLKGIPFIFLSARSLKEDKLQGLQLGVDDYITKPFNKHEFKARIKNLLQNKLERETWMAKGEFDSLKITNLDEGLLKRAESSVLKNISDSEYKVNHLAADLNYSQRQLTRLLKNLTGMTPVNFILELRLQRAYVLLKSHKFPTINEVRYEVGIESASYFTRKFKERFGVSPGSVIH